MVIFNEIVSQRRTISSEINFKLRPSAFSNQPFKTKAFAHIHPWQFVSESYSIAFVSHLTRKSVAFNTHTDLVFWYKMQLFCHCVLRYRCFALWQTKPLNLPNCKSICVPRIARLHHKILFLSNTYNEIIDLNDQNH